MGLGIDRICRCDFLPDKEPQGWQRHVCQWNVGRCIGHSRDGCCIFCIWGEVKNANAISRTRTHCSGTIYSKKWGYSILKHNNKVQSRPLVLECSAPGRPPRACFSWWVLSGKILHGLVYPLALVRVPVAEVVVGLGQHVLDVLTCHVPALEEVVGALYVADVLDKVFHNPAAHFWAKRSGHISRIIESLIYRSPEGICALFFVRIFFPLLLNLLEALKVHGPSAHGTRRLGALAVPCLDTRLAERVAAYQLAEGSGLAVAD